MARLLEMEKSILQTKPRLGNDILYDLCEKMPLGWKGDGIYTAEEALSAQMWLIGRSYAASPERRNYHADKAIQLNNSGNGLDTFFDLLAAEMIQHKEYEEIVQTLISIKGRDPYFSAENAEDYDRETLRLVVKTVLKLNELIKSARFAVDKIDLANAVGEEESKLLKETQSNSLSFCSKFLHFHAPHQVFIMDSLTREHFKQKNRKEYGFQFSENGEPLDSEISIPKDDANTLVKNLVDNLPNDLVYTEGLYEKKQTANKKEVEFIIHCAREYLLAKALHEQANVDYSGQCIPRMIDTYMLCANK